MFIDSIATIYSFKFYILPRGLTDNLSEQMIYYDIYLKDDLY